MADSRNQYFDKSSSRLMLPKDRNPFFIVGSGRSGSTLLSRLLNASGQVFVPPESDFIARAYPYLAGKSHYTSYDYHVVAEFFRLCSQENGWGLSRQRIVSALMERVPESLADVMDTICCTYLASRDVPHSRWGIKRPVLIASINRIIQVFPSAQFLHIVRDGRDVLASYRRVGSHGFRWGPRGAATTAMYWIDGLRRVSESPPGQFLDVRYEELVAQPRQQLERVCEFLGIRFTDDMITSVPEFTSTLNIVSPSHRDTIHSKIFSNVDQSSVERFRTDLSETDIRRFEMLAGPWLRAYRYELLFPEETGAGMRLVRTGLQHLARLWNMIRYRVRDHLQWRRAKSGARQNRST